MKDRKRINNERKREIKIKIEYDKDRIELR